MSIDELKKLWNSSADRCNQWDELGLDEIVFFAQKQARIECADKFQSDLDNYVAAHKLDWSEADEAVRYTLEMVIKELRNEPAA